MTNLIFLVWRRTRTSQNIVHNSHQGAHRKGGGVPRIIRKLANSACIIEHVSTRFTHFNITQVVNTGIAQVAKLFKLRTKIAYNAPCPTLQQFITYKTILRCSLTLRCSMAKVWKAQYKSRKNQTSLLTYYIWHINKNRKKYKIS